MEPRVEIAEVNWFTIEETLKRVDVSTSTKVGIAIVTGRELKADLTVTMKDAIWVQEEVQTKNVCDYCGDENCDTAECETLRSPKTFLRITNTSK